MEDSLTGRTFEFGDILYLRNPLWMPERFYIHSWNILTGEIINFPPIRFGDGINTCDILDKFTRKLGWRYTLEEIVSRESKK